MFVIEKNSLLSSTNKFVRYEKSYEDLKVIVTVRPDTERETVRIKIRVKGFDFWNKVTFDLIEIPMDNNHKEERDNFFKQGGVSLNFNYGVDCDLQEKLVAKEKILNSLNGMLEGIEDIIIRWITIDGLYFLLTNDSSKYISLLTEMHYREAVNNGDIPEDIAIEAAEDIKADIEEQLSEFNAGMLGPLKGWPR
jgi:hypothetical protein